MLLYKYGVIFRKGSPADCMEPNLTGRYSLFYEATLLK